MTQEPPRWRRRHSNRRPYIFIGLVAVLLLVLVEGYRTYAFYHDVSASRDILLSLKSDLDVHHLDDGEDATLVRRERLVDAQQHLDGAAGFVRHDPFVFVGRHVPFAGKQVEGLRTLVLAAQDATGTGLEATDVALAFTRFDRDQSQTSIEDAMLFLSDQQPRISSHE